jgi:hypothetical protein
MNLGSISVDDERSNQMFEQVDKTEMIQLIHSESYDSSRVMISIVYLYIIYNQYIFSYNSLRTLQVCHVNFFWIM